MATRLSTTQSAAEGAAWTPTVETILQMQSVSPLAQIAVMGRVDANAPYVRIATLEPNLIVPLSRLAKFPSLKLEVIKNPAGAQITVWDNE